MDHKRTYRLVEDHRTSYKTSQLDGVLGGNLDGFMEAYLLRGEHPMTSEPAGAELPGL